ncbi:hypothetical protein P7K49_027097, partial [Saguinus oedipus]
MSAASTPRAPRRPLAPLLLRVALVPAPARPDVFAWFRAASGQPHFASQGARCFLNRNRIKSPG